MLMQPSDVIITERTLIDCHPQFIQCNVVITWSIFSQIFTKDTHSSPVRAKYGGSFVDSASDWYSASVSAIIYTISYYFGLRYNDTRLYNASNNDGVHFL